MVNNEDNNYIAFFGWVALDPSVIISFILLVRGCTAILQQNMMIKTWDNEYMLSVTK